jgi:ABC-2 type transport system permease protein
MWRADVAARALQTRSRLAVGCGAGLAVFAVFAAWAYGAMIGGDDGDDLFNDLPEAFESLIGATGGSGNYVAAEIFGLVAPLLILVVAISGAAAALAGEEDARTAELLLTQPIERRTVVVTKSVVLVFHLAVVAVFYLVGMALGQALFGLSLTYGGIAVSTVQLFALALAFAGITLAVADSTGSKPIAIAAGTVLAVVSNLMAGLLPLVDGLENLAKVSPWYYFTASDPLSGTLDLGDLAVLLGLATAGFAVGVWVVDRRDIKVGRGRLRFEVPAIRSLTRPRVAGMFTKALSDNTTMIWLTGGGLALMSIAIAAMFTGMQQTLADISASLPDGMTAMLGTTDMATPSGWMTAEMLSLTAPIAVIAVAVVVAVNGIAGEDADRTLALLVAAPVRRGWIVRDQTAVMLIAVGGVCLLTGVGFAVGSLVGGLDLTTKGIVGAMAHLAMLAVFFGALAGALGANCTKRTALGAVSILALVTWLANWLFSLSDGTDWLTMLTPWNYYVASDPLVNGADLGHLAALAVGAATAIAVTAPLFGRREIAA